MNFTNIAQSTHDNWLRIFSEIKMLTISDTQVTVTFHDYTKTWNEAELICQANGGKLFVEDSIERSIVLEYYKSLWNMYVT